VASFGLRLDSTRRRVGTGVGSAAPTPRAAGEAEEFLTGELASAGAWESREPIAPSVMRRFAELVASASAPIDDVRGSADYRRHALGVMARRTLGWAWDEYRNGVAA